MGAVCDYAYALNVRSPWQGLGLHVLGHSILHEGYFSDTQFAYAKNEGFRRKISLIEVYVVHTSRMSRTTVKTRFS